MVARKPSPKDATVDFEDLIAAPAEDLPQAPEPVSENEPEVESAAQKRIRELKEALAKPIPVPEPVAEETAEDREIKELETQLAIRNAAILENATERFAPAKGEVTIIHVETDGFTEFGRVWLRGQNIHIDEVAYKRTLDRNGNSWLDTFVDNPTLQYRVWGGVYIGPGEFQPRPGESVFDDEVAREDARRKGAVPSISPGID